MSTKNLSLARWFAYASIIGIVLGVLAGVVGSINPSDVFTDGASPYNFATSTGRVVAVLNGLAVLGFTAGFLGFYFVGAVGFGALGKTATILTAVSNLGPALSFFHSAISGQSSPLYFLGFLTFIAWPLLTFAALRTKKVATVSALWPLLTLIALAVVELGFPINGVMAMIHQIIYGSIGFLVLYEANRSVAASSDSVPSVIGN